MTPEQTVPRPIAGAPLVRNAQHAELVRRLEGAVTTPRWLPAGAWPEVDELREQHFEHLRAVAVIQAEEDALRAGWADADEAYQGVLDEAARTFAKQPKAKLPPTEIERQEVLAPIEARTWAALGALAGWADQTLEELRQREDELAAGLVGELGPLDQEAAELQRRLGEIAGAKDRLARRALWLRRTTDNELAGRRFEPGEVDVPSGTPPLPVSADSLTRGWAELRPWNAGYEDPEDFVSRSFAKVSEEVHAEQTIREIEESTNAS